MDIDRFKNDLRHIVQLLDPYVTLTGENYIQDTSLRSDLNRIREPIQNLLKQVDHIILQKKIHELKSEAGNDITDRIEEVLGIKIGS